MRQSPSAPPAVPLPIRLIKETVSNALYRWTGTVTGSTAYSPDRLNRYASVGGTGFSYDANANLTSDGTWTFGYDPENWLLSAAKTGTSASYLYDPLGRRVKSTVGSGSTVFLHADDEEIGEYSASGNLQLRYVPGPEIDRPIGWVNSAGTKRFFHADRCGSIIAVTNTSAGASEGPYSYDAYGAPSATTGTPIKYTGRRYDAETGLYYYRARYYSPGLGRFMQTDPVGYDAGMNLYEYVQDDPINNVDPSGLQQALPAPGPILLLPPVFIPGSPENKEWSRQVSGSVVWLRDQIRAGYNRLNHRNEAPPVPDKPVGVKPTDGNKNRTTSGPLAPENGGTGDPEADFDILTGGHSDPAPQGSTYPPGTQIGSNGITYRPPSDKSGARIDIPAAGDKKPKPETLHYPPPPPPPPKP